MNKLIGRRPPGLWTKHWYSMLAGENLPKRFALENFPPHIRNAATTLAIAREKNYQIKPLTGEKDFEALDQSLAYDIAAAGCGIRLAQGAVPIGRKIGFTNSNIWEQYAVDVPTWGYMYDTTVQTAEPDKVVDLRPFSNLQPRIEPEVVLGLSAAPSAEMSDEELISCVGWIAHGFEIVVSIFPDWKFKAVDTTAACALHGCLILGPKFPLYKWPQPQVLFSQLEDFQIQLSRNGTVEDTGKGSNVLGGPIAALRHVVKSLAEQNRHPQLNAGEMISTGTLTSAFLIADGERWHTNFKGIDLPGLDVRFKLA